MTTTRLLVNVTAIGIGLYVLTASTVALIVGLLAIAGLMITSREVTK